MIVTNRDMPKITYLLKGGRQERLAERGQGPTEFFYGYQQLLSRGVDVSILEDSDVGMGPPLPTMSHLANKLSRFLGGLPVGMAMSLLTRHGCRKLDGADCVVATTNGMGMALAIARALGRLRTPVLLLAMGLLPHHPGRLQAWLYRRLARHIRIVCISRGEASFLRQVFRGQDIAYVPFGVDQRFWSPAADPMDRDYVLAIGNDLARDWPTLVSAWCPDFPKLRIVTCLPVPAHGANVEVIRGDWRIRALSDEDIRSLYRGAKFVVIPLRDTIQPAGQSACLQAMACGRPVILSNIAGLWDRDLMRDGENVLLVPPGDRAALTAAVAGLLADPARGERIGRIARDIVDKELNTDAMASALQPILETTDTR